MSTKIHIAYRTRRSSDLWSLVHDCHVHGERATVAVLSRLLQQHHEDAIKERYRKQLGDPHRNEWNFDVAIAIREHRGRLYAIPHCDMEMGNVCDFLKRDERLEDFAYWNNTDRPASVTARAWAHRAEVWNALSRKGWGHCLTVTICDWARLPALLWRARERTTT